MGCRALGALGVLDALGGMVCDVWRKKDGSLELAGSGNI